MDKKVFTMYQRQAFRFLVQRKRAALFMEMRMGKTLVIIRACRYLQCRRVLIVAPLEALGGWIDELEQDAAGYTLVYGSRRRREEELQREDVQFYLTNKESWRVTPDMWKYRWDAVVIDESQCIKSPRSKITKYFLKHFKDVPVKYISTGTPCLNGQEDLCCQFLFLQDKFCGFKDYWSFRDTLYFNVGYSYYPKKDVKKRIQHELDSTAFVLRRKDVRMDPIKHYIRRTLTLPRDMRKAYSELEDDWYDVLADEGADSDINHVVKKYVRLRQLCSGFNPNGGLVWEGKVQELKRLLVEDFREEQVIVWFTFKPAMVYCYKELDYIGVPTGLINGSVPPAARRDVIKQFQEGTLRVLLVQESTGKEGVDFSCCDTVIYYTLPLSATTLVQTEDRIVSVRKKTELLYVYLTVQDSVEEDIFATVKAKMLQSDKSLMTLLRQQMRERLGGVRA